MPNSGAKRLTSNTVYNYLQFEFFFYLHSHIQRSLKWKPEKIYKAIHNKKDTVQLHWPSNSVRKTSRTSGNVILRHGFLRRISLLVALSTSHASPPIPSYDLKCRPCTAPSRGQQNSSKSLCFSLLLTSCGELRLHLALSFLDSWC
jgi:hypothetical protein